MEIYKQTAVLYMPDTPLRFTTIETRPLPPRHLRVSLAHRRPVSVMREDKTQIIWWPDGTVVTHFFDGASIVFFPRPTMKDAFDYSHNNQYKCGYFKFNSDGSVYARCFGDNYYWGAPRSEDEDDIVHGTEIFPRETEPGVWTFDDPTHDSDSDNDDMRHIPFAGGRWSPSPPSPRSEEGDAEDSPSSCCGRYFCQCRDCIDLLPKD